MPLSCLQLSQGKRFILKSQCLEKSSVEDGLQFDRSVGVLTAFILEIADTFPAANRNLKGDVRIAV